ncbi:MAG: hypothetical protein F6K23_19315 [Okeania sp. SIO2C9]|nr:hypothetical protein [Okeania sp. SIO2C9]NEQ74995.1 hypothetical protein [Okeania sp. SIO2C9]
MYIAEERRKKEEGKIFLCLGFKLLISPKLYFDCYNFNLFPEDRKRSHSY